MARDPDARNFSLTWDGGYLTCTRGLLKYLYGADFEEKVGAGKARTVQRKGYDRTRVIGGPSKAIAPTTFSVIDYPHKLKSSAMGGQQISILAAGEEWTARLGGSVQDFKAFLAGTGKPTKAFTFFTEKGTEFSSAS